VTLEASADQLPLRTMATQTGGDLCDAGTLTFKLDGHGTARAPAGALALDLEGAAGRRFPATDAALEVKLHEQEGGRVTARVTRRGQVLGALEAALHLPSARLTQLPALAAAPLTVRAHVGPVRVQRKALPPATERDKEGTLGALLEANLQLDGTLHAPRLRLSASADQARLDDHPLGRADLVVRYQDARPDLAFNV